MAQLYLYSQRPESGLDDSGTAGGVFNSPVKKRQVCRPIADVHRPPEKLNSHVIFNGVLIFSYQYQ